jgi:hypothetical protein
MILEISMVEYSIACLVHVNAMQMPLSILTQQSIEADTRRRASCRGNSCAAAAQSPVLRSLHAASTQPG